MDDFEEAYVRFRSTPFPDRPSRDDLLDWSFDLVTLDNHVAGYAIRVRKGELSPKDITETGELISHLEGLRASLNVIEPLSGKDHQIAEELRQYLRNLELLMRVLDRLARE